MRGPAIPSIDQLLVLLAVAEAEALQARPNAWGVPRLASAMQSTRWSGTSVIRYLFAERPASRSSLKRAKRSSPKRGRLPIASRRCALASEDSSMNLNLKCQLWSTACCRAIG
jgi:hypothetical protein